MSISKARIYLHVWHDKRKKGGLHLDLRHQGRKYIKRLNHKDSRVVLTVRIDIDKGPKEAGNRSEFVIDIIIGRNHKEAINSLNVRSCGMLWMKKAQKKEKV